MNLKYIIWLRNLMIVLYVIILADYLVMKYYDGVPPDTNPAKLLIGIVPLLGLEYYIRQRQMKA